MIDLKLLKNIIFQEDPELLQLNLRLNYYSISDNLYEIEFIHIVDRYNSSTWIYRKYIIEGQLITIYRYNTEINILVNSYFLSDTQIKKINGITRN